MRIVIHVPDKVVREINEEGIPRQRMAELVITELQSSANLHQDYTWQRKFLNSDLVVVSETGDEEGDKESGDISG